MSERTPIPPGDYEIVGPTATVDASNGIVSLRLWSYPEDVDQPVSVVVKFSAPAAADIGGRLATHGAAEARDLLIDALIGECETCQNIRLIDVPRHDGRHTEKVRCPDCADRFNDVRGHFADHVVRVGDRDKEAFA